MLENKKSRGKRINMHALLRLHFPLTYSKDNYKFFLTRSEIPRLFPYLEEFFSLSISSPVATMFDLLKKNSLQLNK